MERVATPPAGEQQAPGAPRRPQPQCGHQIAGPERHQHGRHHPWVGCASGRQGADGVAQGVVGDRLERRRHEEADDEQRRRGAGGGHRPPGDPDAPRGRGAPAARRYATAEPTGRPMVPAVRRARHPGPAPSRPPRRGHVLGGKTSRPRADSRSIAWSRRFLRRSRAHPRGGRARRRPVGRGPGARRDVERRGARRGFPCAGPAPTSPTTALSGGRAPLPSGRPRSDPAGRRTRRSRCGAGSHR